jgi:ribose-phosphate pyrophosphokinase
MKIFSGSSNKPLAEKIAKSLNTELSPLEVFIFPDGERRIRAEEKVVGEQTAVVQSANTPADTNYMELFFIADALKRSGASSVAAVVPYLGYQRQDHVFRDGEAVSLEVIVETLEAVGVSRIITIDLHSIKIPELFRIPIIHLSAIEIFAEKIKEISQNDFVLVSPDMGGIRRIKQLSELLGNAPFATIEKNRDLETGSVSADKIEGEDINGKDVFIVDDMISTGKTIAIACDLLEKRGAKNIYVFATHAVFSDEASEILGNSKAKEIFVTDSVFIPKEKHFPKLKILSVDNLIAGNLKS